MSPFLENIHSLDQELTLAINSMHSSFTDNAVVFFSDIKVWIPLYLMVAAFILARLGWKKGLTVILSMVIVFAISDQIANLVKDSVARLRPCYNTYMLDNGLHMLEKRGGLYGFYSSHASNAFGFAMCAIIGIKNDTSRKYIAFSSIAILWAALVGISRILAGKHYLGDVLVGTIVGILMGTALALAARAVIRKFFEKSVDTAS